MRAAKVQASLRIRAVSPEPRQIRAVSPENTCMAAHTSSESRGTFRQKARSLAYLNGWACAVKSCHDGMLEDRFSRDEAQLIHPRYHSCVVFSLNNNKGLKEVQVSHDFGIYFYQRRNQMYAICTRITRLLVSSITIMSWIWRLFLKTRSLNILSRTVLKYIV